MYLIAESGSTKCDWMLVDKEGNYIDLYKSMGYNPFFHSTEFIFNDLSKHKDLIHIADKVERVYFYGAGCESNELNLNVANALKRTFQNATVLVDHDLKAAAYSTFDTEPCITCIIGTGSNSCYFDGENIYEAVPALAYILGDEGSGSYLGKKLLAAYLYHKLPKHIEQALEAEFKISKAEIFSNVYEKPHANVYLASFTRFISKFKEDALIKSFIIQGMREFIQNHVCCFDNYKNIPVCFVGSIAFHFQDELKQVADEYEVHIKKIIKEPIKNLVDYHVKYIFKYQIV